jgi:hypothetical protein
MSVPVADSGAHVGTAPTTSDPTGLHRVLDGGGQGRVLPQAAQRLDTRRELWPDEVRVRVETLNLDAASFRQLESKHDHDGDAVRREVLEIVATRGKMQNPVTGSGGMLIGIVEEVGPERQSILDRIGLNAQTIARGIVERLAAEGHEPLPLKEKATRD